MTQKTLTLYDTHSLRHFMSEAHNYLPIPQDTLPAYTEIHAALDDELYNGYSGISVSEEVFNKVAVYIGTAARIRMKVAARNLRHVMRYTPEEVTRLNIESPKMFEAFTTEIAEAGQEFDAALNFRVQLTKRQARQQEVPTEQAA